MSADAHARSEGPATVPAGRAWRWWVVAVAGLAALIFGLHASILGSGLFLDDHAHYRQLREAGWSLRDLADACRLELNGGVVHIWWLPHTTLRFFRPISFGLMKLAYTAVGWRPEGMHLTSLIWHLVTCVLLVILLRRLGAARWLALVIAALFAIHPAHVATVRWIACQTELIVTALLLGATLCFARFRGWPAFLDERRNAAGHWGWGAASAGLFALALGCRENAIVFPFVLAAMEPLVGRAGRRRAAVLFAVYGALVVGYLWLRASMLGGAALPPRPYVYPLAAPGFARFVFDKALYYLIGEILLVPCVPIGGMPYFQARPLVFYGLASAALALTASVCVWRRRRLAAWLAPVWMLGFVAPLLPVFESPHHLYLPGVGWALVAWLLFEAIGPSRAAAARWARWIRRTAQAVVLLGTGALFGLWTYYAGLAFDTGQYVESRVADEIISADVVADGDTIYLANMPLLAHYTQLLVEDRTGRRGLRVVPLTWSPRLLGCTPGTELTWIDDRTIEIRIARERYFSGPLGRLARESTGGDVPDVVDRREDLGFTMRVLERDAGGIAAIRFEFVRPLSSPGVHLFWGSGARWAQDVTPRGNE